MAENHDLFHNPKWQKPIILNLPTTFQITRKGIVVTAILPDGSTWRYEDCIPTSKRSMVTKEIHDINGEL